VERVGAEREAPGEGGEGELGGGEPGVEEERIDADLQVGSPPVFFSLRLRRRFRRA
jgi:hypothetical protein